MTSCFSPIPLNPFKFSSLPHTTLSLIVLEVTTIVNPYPFLADGGELGELTRQHDWSTTSLGMPDQWPQSLRATLSIILNAKAPMFLWWGSELIQFYNDGYRPSLGDSGKHPTALGQKGVDCWPEIWPIIKPLIDQVLGGGEATWNEDQLIPIYRNGKLEDVYWTFGYSAVKDESGQVAGVLVVCTETTSAVTDRQKLKDSENRFRSIIEQAPMAIGLFKGRNMVIEVANDRILDVWHKDPSVIGLPVIEALPEIEGQGYTELLKGVYDTGEPFAGDNLLVRLNRQGRLEDVYFDLLYMPLRGSGGIITGVMVLANEVTEQVLARQKIEQSESRYRTLSADLEQQVKQRTLDLEARNQELAALNDKLSESNNLLARSNENLQKFAYVASHDLQEPLRKIQQFGDILKSQYQEGLGDGVDYLERMQLAANRMSLLIRDLLEYSRVATHRDRSELLSLHEVVIRALTDLELVIAETEAQVNVEPLPTVLGDPSQLGQLFLNLLSNALKFRQPDTTPQIDIRSVLVAADDLPPSVKPVRLAPAYHQIEIADNGIGFDDHQVDRIFEVFQRLHGRNKFAGTGIGLAICERVVANHGGGITATSQPGQGATFKVYLPTEPHT